MDNISNLIISKFKNIFPNKILQKINDDEIKINIITRINNMNKLYEEIKIKPFSYCDEFYGIHGHHRNRR